MSLNLLEKGLDKLFAESKEKESTTKVNPALKAIILDKT